MAGMVELTREFDRIVRSWVLRPIALGRGRRTDDVMGR